VALTGLGVPNPPPTTTLFGHVAILVEEQHQLQQCHQLFRANLAGLMVQYGLATQYYANTHLRSATTSCSPLARSSRTMIAKSTQASPFPWTTWFGNWWPPENLEGLCRKPALGRYLGGDTTSGGGQYYVRHVPVAYLTDVQSSSANSKTLSPLANWPRIS